MTYPWPEFAEGRPAAAGEWHHHREWDPPGPPLTLAEIRAGGRITETLVIEGVAYRRATADEAPVVWIMEADGAGTCVGYVPV